MNYTELVAAIQDYTENTFLPTELATFVQNAEQRIYNSVQLPALRKNVTGNLTAGNKYLSCPSNFLAVYSLAVIDAAGTYNYLLDKDVNFVRESYPSPDSIGLPQYYALFGPQYSYPNETAIILGPTPDADYSAELHYFYYPDSIVTAQTSWLGDNFESALLYGSLLEAYTFMKGEPDIMAKYQERYNEAMVLLKQLGDGKDRSDAYRTGQVRYPVK